MKKVKEKNIYIQKTILDKNHFSEEINLSESASE